MAIRDEIRILKANTLEEFRQKTNELSIDKVGDNKLLSSSITDKTYEFTATAGQKHFEISGRFEVFPEQTIDRTTGVAEAFRTGAVRVKSDSTELLQGLSANEFIVPNYALKVTLTGSPTIPSEFVEDAVLTQSGGFSGVLLSADNTQLRFKSFTGTFSDSQNLGIPHTEPLKRISAVKISSNTVINASHGILIELITPASVGDSIQIIATSLVDAINELQDDIGVTENLSTDAGNTVNAINEHETDLYGTGNVIFGGLSSTGFQDAIEEVRAELGAHTSLGTTHTSTAVGAINELEAAVRGNLSNYTLNTTANDLITAVNEHETDIGDMSLTTTASDLTDAINELDALQGNNSLTTTGSTLTAAVNELDAELGTISTNAMGTSASTVSGAIAEHEAQIGNIGITTIASGNNSITGALSQLHSELGSAALNTSANTHTGAINEHEADIGNMTLTGLSATDLSAGLRELASEKLDITNTTASGQSLSGNINYTTAGGNGTFDFGPGTVLDISDGTLLVSAAGGVANFGSAFLNLDGEVAQMGLQVDRDHITPSGSMTNHDVKLQWNEALVSSTPERAWQVVGMADNGSTNTADLITFYNAKDLIANNTETGISVTWDSSNQNFDFALTADPQITLGGDLGGTATLTNLTGNTTLTATIQAGSVENSMLAGSIAASKLAGSIPNSKLVNTGISIDAETGTTHLINLGETLTVNGTSGEIETNINNNVLAIGLPSNVTIGNNLTVTGNLTVQGTQTILNTSTLEVEDTLVLAGNDLSSEPTSGGFGLEVGPITSPSGVASGVTGAHSIVYNYATDRWEADGSLILSSATLATPQIEGSDFGPGDNLTFTAGTGLSESVSGFAVTYTNTDKGSSQNIFKNITANSGGTATANSNNDTLTISGGSSLTSVRSGDTITLNHTSTGATSVNNSGNTVIQDLTIDGNGHVTAVGSATIDTYDGWALTVGGTNRGTITENERVSFTGGTSIDVAYSATNNNITFNHANTSSVGNINASGTTFVQDLTFDTHGHVTAASTGSFTLGNGTLTVQGTGVLGGSGTFTANQSTAGTISITHDNVSRSDSTSAQSRSYGQSFTVIDSVSTSSQGHLTGVNTKTVTLPASDNTNTIPNNATISISAGTSLTGGGSFTTDQASSATITVNHADTSSQGSVNNSGRTYIQDIGLDTHGHITSITSATETVTNTNTVTQIREDSGAYRTGNITLQSGTNVNITEPSTGTFRIDSTDTNTNTTYSAGTGLDLSGTTFSVEPDLRGEVTRIGYSSTTYTNMSASTSVQWVFGNNVEMQIESDGDLHVDSDIVAFSTSTNSDKKLKTNIVTVENALDKVCQLDGVTFDWIKDGKESAGVIAQNVEKVLPRAVKEVKELNSDDTHKTVDYNQLSALFIEAIKELKDENKSLRSEIEELKSINNRKN